MSAVVPLKTSDVVDDPEADAKLEAAIQNKTPEEIQKEKNERLQSLKLWDKFRAKEFHKVSKEDLSELFNVFDIEGSGVISVEEFLEIKKVPGLNLTQDDIQMLADDSDSEGMGQISAYDLYKALTVGKAAYSILQKSMYSKHKEYFPTECHVDELIEWANEENDTKEALWSLPWTLMLFAFYVMFISKKVTMDKAWWSHHALWKETEWGPYFLLWVFDSRTLHAYLANSFLPIWFKQDFNFDDRVGRVARENQLVSGIRFRKRFTEGFSCDSLSELSLAYDAVFGGKCYKMDHPELIEDKYWLINEKHSLLRERLANFTREPAWLNYSTTRFSIDTLTFNANIGTFTYSEYFFVYQNNGFMRKQEFRETWTAEPYRTWDSAIPDVLFSIIVMKILVSELKEFIPAVNNGLDALQDYAGFWNIVDWACVLWAFVNALVWYMVYSKVTIDLPKAIAAYPQDFLDALVYENNTYLGIPDVELVNSFDELYSMLDDIFAAAEDIRTWNMIFRSVGWFYMFLLVLKFFKAFRANKRLDVVVGTLTGCVVDVSHFGVVFVTVFSCYAWSGHIMFGQHIKGFSTPIGALFFCFRGGIGPPSIENLTPFLQFLSYSWTLSFQFLVMILIFNILMGLIFGAYGRVCAEAGNPRSVIRQMKDEWGELSECQDFMPLNQMLFFLEDEVDPIHPGEKVTVRSMMKAFKETHMSFANASWIVKKASDYAKLRQGDITMTLDDGIRNVGQIRTIVFQTEVVLENLMYIVREEQRKPQAERLEAIMAGYEPNDPEDMERYRMDREDAIMHSGAAPTKKPRPGSPGYTDPKQAKAGGGLGNPMIAFAKDATATTSSAKGSLALTGGDKTKDPDEEDKPPTEASLIAQLSAITGQFKFFRNDQLQLIEGIKSQALQHRKKAATMDDWLLQRVTSVTSQCEQIEIGAGKLSETLQGVDKEALQAMPERTLDIVERIQAPRLDIIKRGSTVRIGPCKIMEDQVDEMNKKVDHVVDMNGEHVDFRRALLPVEDAMRQLVAEHAERNKNRAAKKEKSQKGPRMTHRDEMRSKSASAGQRDKKRRQAER
eukprot:TRINITY_DN3517_c0_g5_i1.p1 TRINITY_DN3517_c0_g5~~TRINITY_DN3517_c0_g5_i1.p1  ORF type:complete len:1068 (+),score=174.11 TRINITY_DN3517_c0_g5_i1:65-3268(+)